MPHDYFDPSPPIVLGHRGSAGDRPENTLPSFARALEVGAQMLESDVHLTRDGVPVLLHDPQVDRTTNGSGAVSDLSLAELRALDAGHHFTPDGGATFPYRGQGICIPTLEEAFETYPDARFNLELKADDTILVDRTLDLVKRLGREELTLLTAGEDSMMQKLQGGIARSGVRPAVGASLADILAVVRSALDGSSPATEAMALQIPADFGGRPLVTPELVRHAHTHDIQIHVWTINERDEIFRLLDMGADGIVTDFPGRMTDWLRERR